MFFKALVTRSSLCKFAEAPNDRVSVVIIRLPTGSLARNEIEKTGYC